MDRAVRKTCGALRLKNPFVSIAFVDNKVMRALNRLWRGRNRPTDVLSFGPSENFKLPGRGRDLGEIVIAYEEAKKEARRKGWTLAEELALLTVHGLLHCAGFDHETEKQAAKMLPLQEKILKEVMKKGKAQTGFSRLQARKSRRLRSGSRPPL